MYSDTRICLRDHNLVKLLLYIFARLKRVLNILVLTGMAGICTTNCNYPLFMDYLNIIYYLPLLHHIKINEGLYLIIGFNLYKYYALDLNLTIIREMGFGVLPKDILFWIDFKSEQTQFKQVGNFI